MRQQSKLFKPHLFNQLFNPLIYIRKIKRESFILSIKLLVSRMERKKTISFVAINKSMYVWSIIAALVARSSKRVKLSDLTGANRVESHREGWKSKRQPRGSPKENRERGAWTVASFEKGEKSGGKENRGRKSGIKGRRRGRECRYIANIYT